MTIFFSVEDLDRMDEEYERELKILENGGFAGNPYRKDYLEKISRLQLRAFEMEAEGMEEEQIAREIYQERRNLARDFRDATPPLIREYTCYKTSLKYGNPIGPTYDQLYSKKHSCRKIIEGASRPSDHLEERLNIDDFKAWYEGMRNSTDEYV